MAVSAHVLIQGFTSLLFLAAVSAQLITNIQPEQTENDCICNVTDSICKCTFTIHHRLTMILEREKELVKAVNGTLQFASGNETGTLLSDEQIKRVITADGENSRLVIAINDVFPGPRIEVYENQLLELKVINTLHTDSVTVHFHGLHQKGTPWMDGVAFVTQCPVLPGQTFVYRFSAYPPGTSMYHAHIGDQRSMGLYGPLIVRSRYDEKKPDRQIEEIIVTIQDWNHDADAETAYHRMITEQFDPDGNKIDTTESIDGGRFSKFHFHSGLFNGKGRYWFNSTDHNMAPLERFKVRSGIKYRFRIIGAMTLYPMRVFILGQKINLLASDGFQVSLVNESLYSIVVHPGERYDFEWTFSSPTKKEMFLIAETLETPASIGNLYHAAEAVLEVTDHADPASNNPVNPKTDMICVPESKCNVFNCPFDYIGLPNYRCLDLNDLKNNDNSRSTEHVEGTIVDAEYFFNFAFPGPEGNTPGSVNGRQFVSPPSPPLTQPNSLGTVPCDENSCTNGICSCMYEQVIPHNKLIQMTFLNLGKGLGWSHPVHLHGHSFYVMKMGLGTYNSSTGRKLLNTADINCTDEYNYCSEAMWTDPAWAGGNIPNLNDDPPEKDTVIVPTGGYVVIRFVSDNPGKWFLHCHIDLHNTNGMGMVISEAPEQIPTPPKGFPVCGNFLNDEHQNQATHCEDCEDHVVTIALLAAFLGVTALILIVTCTMYCRK